MRYFCPIQPEQVFSDRRGILHFRADDPTTQTGKHYVTLLDGGYFVFVTAYQSVNDTYVKNDRLWQGGTQLELPAMGLKPLIIALEHHVEHTHHLSLRNQAVFKYAKTIEGEPLSLSRDYVLPGYILKNHARKVHFPWAGDEWVQSLRLADSVLFEQDYCAVLRQLAEDYG